MIAILLSDDSDVRALVRYAGGSVRDVGWFSHPATLGSWLEQQFVHTIVLVDGAAADWYLDTALRKADLIVVPPQWLNGIPRDDYKARARRAARLALDHRACPIQHYVRAEQYSLIPF